MNGMQSGRAESFWMTGMIVPCMAYVSKVRTIDQRVHVDCYDPETAQQWFRLPLFVFGGSQNSFLAVPPVPFPRDDLQQPEEEDGAQVIVMPRHKQGPIALGCVQHPTSGYEDAPRDQEAVADTADHPLPTTPEEHIWQHAGVRLQLTSDGSLVIDVQESKKPVRIQLPGSGRLRVSRGGSAGGRLTLWHKLGDWLGFDLRNWATDISNRIGHLENQISLIRDALLSPTTGADPIIVVAEANQLVEYQIFTGVPDETYPAVPNMAAAAIDVSKDVG